MKDLLKSMLAQAGESPSVTADGDSQAQPSPRSMDELLTTVRRLEPGENSFGIPVIDCREFATSLLADSADPIPPETAILPRDQRGTLPEGATRLDCALNYPLSNPPLQGLLFLARSMQDKWHIFHYDNRFIFTRSWTGDPLFVAEFEHRRPVLTVKTVYAAPGAVDGGAKLAVAMVDFLIKSHLFRVAVPHPLPAELPELPSLVATWSFNHFGRWGHYGAWDDLVRLQLMALGEGLVLRWTS